MRYKKLLILGGTGYLGHHLLPQLAQGGCQLTVLTRNQGRARELALIPNLLLRNADVHDPEVLARWLRGHDAVINLIGILNESTYSTFSKTHVELTEKLIAACEQAGVRRLLHMSVLKAGQGLSEYLRTRGHAEQRVKASTLDWTILQPSVIFGTGGDLVSRFAKLLRTSPVLPLPRPHARMAPVHVDDVVRAIMCCLDDNRRIGETLELYGPETLELIEIVRLIARTVGRRRWIIGLPDPLGRIQASLAGLLPGKPFSRDNFLTLRTDSTGSRDGLRELGIEPQHFSTLLPQLLDRGSRASRFDAMRRRLPS